MTLILCLFISKSVFAQNNMGVSDEEQIKEAEQYLQNEGIIVPEEIEELCEFYGDKYNISPELLEAIIWKESRFEKGAINDSRTCVGLMQINTKVHQDRMNKFKIRNIFDPAGNIKIGTDYLSELLENNDLEIAIMLYNGDKKAKKDNYISNYAKNVLEIAEALERVHNK